MWPANVSMNLTGRTAAFLWQRLCREGWHPSILPLASTILCWHQDFSSHSPKALSNRKTKTRQELPYSSGWERGCDRLLQFGLEANRWWERAGRLRTPPKNTISERLWGRLRSRANQPKVPEFITVGRRDFLAVFLQQLVSPEYLQCPKTGLLSGALRPFSYLPFQSHCPLNSLCTCSHHHELLPKVHMGFQTHVPSLMMSRLLRISTCLSKLKQKK